MSDQGDDRDFDAARNRVVGKVQYSRRFEHQGEYANHDNRVGTSARFAYQVVDTSGEITLSGTTERGYEVLIRETQKRREQIKALFFENDRHICTLHLQRLSSSGKGMDNCFTLHDDEIDRLRSLLDMIPNLPLNEGEGDKIDWSLLERALRTPDAWVRMYHDHPEELADLVRQDESAEDILSLGRRRKGLALFKRMLDSPEYVDELKRQGGKQGQEAVWQEFFDQNRWIFGFGLGARLLMAWEGEKLEQTVRGYAITGRGHRADALLRSMGAVSALCFVEIKLPQAPLTQKYTSPYRGEAYVPGKDVSGGVAQVQAAIDRAIREADFHPLQSVDENGFKGKERAYAIRPRSYLVVGSLSQFVDRDNSIAEAPYRSFENYRRSLGDPEIVTYDELYERARGVLADAELAQTRGRRRSSKAIAVSGAIRVNPSEQAKPQ